MARDVDWLVYVFYIWVSLFGIITTSQFWLLANHIFNTREAKRIFPFIGAGAITGGLTGSKLTGSLVGVIGTENLLWVCVALIIGCTAILTTVWGMRQPIETIRVKRSKDGPLSGIWSVILKSKYLSLLGAFIAITVMVATFVDLQFNILVKEEFPIKNERTAFFGDFFFYLSLASLALQLLFSSRILRNFGVGAAILILPTGLLLGSAAIFFMPVLFWSGCMIKISDGGFRYSINKSATELLYLPVPSAIKNQVKGMMDVVGDRVARGIAGAMLYTVVTLIGWKVAEISFLSAALIAVWIFLAIKLKKAYSLEFRESIKKGSLDSEAINVQLREASSIEALEGALSGTDTRQTLFALELIKDTEDTRLLEPLLGLTEHKDSRVRLSALSEIIRLGDESHSDKVVPLISDPEPTVSAEAIRFLCAHTSDSNRATFKKLLNGENPALQASAIRCALMNNDGSLIEDALNSERIEALLSKDGGKAAQAKRELASAIRYAPPDSILHEYLPKFLRDSDKIVIEKAMDSASALHRREHVGRIIGYLSDRSLRPQASAALIKYGAAILGTLRDYLVDTEVSLTVRRRIPRILGSIGTEDAISMLTSQLGIEDMSLRYEVVKALNRIRRDVKETLFERETIEAHMNNEVREFYSRSRHLSANEEAGSTNLGPKLLRQSMAETQKLTLNRTFRLAGLIYPPEDMYFAFSGITSGSSNLRANAIEFLDTIWEKKDKDLIFPIIESDQIRNLSHLANKLFGLRALTLNESLTEILQGVDPWHAALAAYVIQEKKLSGFENELNKLAGSPHPAVRETATSALRVLGEKAPAPTGDDKGAKMTILEKVLALQEVSLFARISTDGLAHLAAIAKKEDFGANEVIYRESEPMSSLYLVLDGKIRLSRAGRDVKLAGPKDVLGSWSLLDDDPPVVTATVVEPSSALKIDREDFFDLIDDHAEITQAIFRSLVRRVRGVINAAEMGSSEDTGVTS